MKKRNPKNYFSVGIKDDVTNNSIDYDPDFTMDGKVTSCLFYGLGARRDGRRQQELDQDHRRGHAQ